MLYIPNNNEISEKDVVKVSSISLTDLAYNIKSFTKVYRSYIRLTKEEDTRILDTLDEFADMLLKKRYSDLFDDRVIIDKELTDRDLIEILRDDELPF